MKLSYAGQCGLYLGINWTEKLVSRGEMWPDVRNGCVYLCIYSSGPQFLYIISDIFYTGVASFLCKIQE